MLNAGEELDWFIQLTSQTGKELDCTDDNIRDCQEPILNTGEKLECTDDGTPVSCELILTHTAGASLD